MERLSRRTAIRAGLSATALGAVALPRRAHAAAVADTWSTSVGSGSPLRSLGGGILYLDFDLETSSGPFFYTADLEVVLKNRFDVCWKYIVHISYVPEICVTGQGCDPSIEGVDVNMVKVVGGPTTYLARFDKSGLTYNDFTTEAADIHNALIVDPAFRGPGSAGAPVIWFDPDSFDNCTSVC